MRRGRWVSAATCAFGALVVLHALSSLIFGTAPQVAGLNLTNLAAFGATALMVRRAVVPGERHWLPLAIGMTCYSCGFLVFAVLNVAHGDVGTPSAADPSGSRCIPAPTRRSPCSLGAACSPSTRASGSTASSLRSRPRRSAAAFAFRPVFDAATGGSISVATKLAYPIGDVVLLALVGGAVVLTGGRPARTWLLLAGGLLVFGMATSTSRRWRPQVSGRPGRSSTSRGGRPADARGGGVEPPAAGGASMGAVCGASCSPSRRRWSHSRSSSSGAARSAARHRAAGDASLRARAHGPRGRSPRPARGDPGAGLHRRPHAARQPAPAGRRPGSRG